MNCLQLHLRDFRAHEQSTFSFAPRINLLYGPNGAGKTNVLEALHYLALGKSFVTSTDEYAVRRNTAGFEVRGTFTGTRRADFEVRLAYIAGEGKRFSINGAPLTTIAEHVGRIPIVVMAPQDIVLTSGGPEERRKFFNNLLSQSRPVYLDDLLRYNRALRQRNELLTRGRRYRSAVAPELLDAWTQELVQLGARLIDARRRATEMFTGYLERAYTLLGSTVERPSLTYVGPVEKEPLEEALQARFERLLPRERELGRTLLGPHRDEFVFLIDGLEVRRYASQGQHRTFGIALRLAQYFFLKDLLEEAPILLLDDLFGILDSGRTRLMLSLLSSEEIGQSIITHPETGPILQHLPPETVDLQTIEILPGTPPAV